mmetsp:Transcript_6491/g.11638  ORF Transcript_6491/g.11638 Transcript_6491/m.11638 type:complete len:80 (-) Transcript_6491:256-495(-)
MALGALSPQSEESASQCCAQDSPSSPPSHLCTSWCCSSLTLKRALLEGTRDACRSQTPGSRQRWAAVRCSWPGWLPLGL